MQKKHYKGAARKGHCPNVKVYAGQMMHSNIPMANTPKSNWRQSSFLPWKCAVVSKSSKGRVAWSSTMSISVT